MMIIIIITKNINKIWYKTDNCNPLISVSGILVSFFKVNLFGKIELCTLSVQYSTSNISKQTIKSVPNASYFQFIFLQNDTIWFILSLLLYMFKIK